MSTPPSVGIASGQKVADPRTSPKCSEQSRPTPAFQASSPSITESISATTPSQAPAAIVATESWYLLHTKPRQEEVALANLERQGYLCYLPRMRLEKIRHRKLSVVNEPMFSRYLFVRLDSRPEAKGWSPIRSTLGVSQLVYFGSRPAQVEDRLVDLLRDRESVLPTTTMFHSGEIVMPIEGPFVGIEAIYQTSDAQQRSIILLDILSKSVPVKIETAKLRKTG